MIQTTTILHHHHGRRTYISPPATTTQSTTTTIPTIHRRPTIFYITTFFLFHKKYGQPAQIWSDSISQSPQLRLTCDQGWKISYVGFASFGNPKEDCGAGFTQGSCHINVISIVELVMISGKEEPDASLPPAVDGLLMGLTRQPCCLVWNACHISQCVGRKRFVGGIAWETSEESFSSNFSYYGELTDSVIMMDKITGIPHGFGFVRFVEPVDTDKVLEQDHVIDGRPVEVKRTVPREDMMGSRGVSRTKKIFVGVIPFSFRVLLKIWAVLNLGFLEKGMLLHVY
ncbi:unnamed protein product [Lactuca virosa]|uniref:RRM domain-containing protein n=1 Tax=Lactuca virosa TaxID=75947 RepID=A0AAU9PJ69_9ASTR|nr:unnamed protein product [Lactuca virosa]